MRVRIRNLAVAPGRALSALRQSQLLEEGAFVTTMEKLGVADLFASGVDVDLARCTPVLVPCTTRLEHSLFRYLRLMQSVASQERVGRRLKYLVIDVGQGRPWLIGGLGLASSLYSLGARDRALGWDHNPEEKHAGLARCMDVSTCMSVQPYSWMLGGKLVAALAASRSLNDDFRRRYKAPLRTLVALCATGVHCPVFNRIPLVAGGLYRHVGETTGFSTASLSSRTFSIARSLCRGTRHSSAQSNILAALRYALRSCGIPGDTVLRRGASKAVYLAHVPRRQGTGTDDSGNYVAAEYGMSEEDIVESWRLLAFKRLSARHDLQFLIRRHVGSSALVSERARLGGYIR